MALPDWELKQEPLWKQEPFSPVYIKFDYDDEAWMFNDDLAHTQEEKPLQQESLTRSERASKLLQELDDWIKDEPFNNWLEEKIELPILGDLPAEEPRDAYYGIREPFIEAVKQQPVVVPPSQHTKETLPPLAAPAEQTQVLLQEFQTIFEEVELNNGTLTPPQSPTQCVNHYPVTSSVATSNPYFFSVPQIISVQPITPVSVSMAPVTSFISVMPDKKDVLLTNLEQMVPATPNPDIDKELADVDELVRSRAEDLDVSNSTWEQASSSVDSVSREDSSVNISPLSPCTSSNSSFESSEDGTDDPEWVPEVNQVSSVGPLKISSRKQRNSLSKPYCRPVPEEKRQRKKEQNKNAATRYRQKKKAEIDKISTEEKDLEKKNDELKQKMTDLSREIKYLKGLMRDVFRAKGLIK